MFRAVLFLMLVGTVSGVQAQNWGVPNGAPKSATVEESVLRGAGAYTYDQGRYLQSLGAYQNLHQDALKKSYENWAEDVRTRNALKDEWHARHHGVDAVTKGHQRLDNLERMVSLKQREQELKDRGLLPKVQPQMAWHGQTFRNWNEFKSSSAYGDFIAERDYRMQQDELKAQEKKAAYDAAVERLKYAGKMRPEEKAEMLRTPTMREIMGEKWWKDWEKYHPHQEF
jgi:hypothetical protein